MFSGIVEEVGTVGAAEPGSGGGLRLWIEARAVLEGTRPGDSLCVSGCCLTVAEMAGTRFAAELVPETLARTTLGQAGVGTRVNLERAMRVDQRVGGHFVQGHVDGVAAIVSCEPEGNGRRMAIEVPESLLPLVAEKGSLAVDGTSLTVAAVQGRRVEIALIPHTLALTVAGDYAPGRRVNLEVDLLARYLARLLEASGSLPGGADAGRISWR